jgi:LacI family transcriptional regulator
MKRITSIDVARAAGVSQPTVSRALRNLSGASPATRDRVLAVAADLGYVPIDSGRAMATRRSRRIAVVSEDLTNPYYPELFEPIRQRLADHDLQAVVVSHTERGASGVDLFVDGSYDGVILTTTLRGSALPHDLRRRGIPHVLVNRLVDHPESTSCAVDNADGMRLIADLVADLGHVEVAMLAGPVETSTGKERSDAVRLALHSRGVRMRRDRIRRVDFDHDAAEAAALDLLSGSPPPTAVICGNDVIALGALSAAASLGLRVPDDLSVTGFDDIRPAGWPLVGLTTVRCDLVELGRLAVELLMDDLDGGRATQKHLRVPVSLVRRRTHGPPAVRSAPGQP